MSFWEKIKSAMRSFMTGRHGPDQLSSFTLCTGLILYILDLFLRTGILSLIGLAMYVITVFRMFSRNGEKRNRENQLYLSKSEGVRAWFRKTVSRAKNAKQFKYVKCPKCGQLLRLPRGVGNVHITCSKCKEGFDAKA